VCVAFVAVQCQQPYVTPACRRNQTQSWSSTPCLRHQHRARRADPKQLQLRFRKLRGRRQALLVSLFAREGVDSGRSDWVRSDKKRNRRSLALPKLQFSSQPPRSETLKLPRCPPAHGGREPLVPVQCRKAPQMLKATRRQVNLRHQLRTDFAQSISTPPARPRLLPSAAPRQRGHASTGAQWRRPSPVAMSSRKGSDRPWRSALPLDFNRPAAVLGPMLFCALARSAAICFSVAMAVVLFRRWFHPTSAPW
jgi:hypothetical protein